MIMAPSGPRLGLGGRHGWMSFGASGMRGGTRGLPVNIGIRDSDLFGSNEILEYESWVPPANFEAPCANCKRTVRSTWAGPTVCEACESVLIITSRGTTVNRKPDDPFGFPMMHDACGKGTSISVRRRRSTCFECGGEILLPFAPLAARILADLLVAPYNGVNYAMHRFFVQETTGYSGMAELMRREWKIEVSDDTDSTTGEPDREVKVIDLPRDMSADSWNEQHEWARKTTEYGSFDEWLSAGYHAQADVLLTLYDPECRNALLSAELAAEIAKVNYHHILPREKILKVRRFYADRAAPVRMPSPPAPKKSVPPATGPAAGSRANAPHRHKPLGRRS